MRLGLIVAVIVTFPPAARGQRSHKVMSSSEGLTITVGLRAAPTGVQRDSLTRIYSESSTGLKYALRAVVHDSATLRGLWNVTVGNRFPAPPPPRIDFSRQMVIVAAMGFYPVAASIRIASVRDSGEVSEVRVVMEGVGDGCVASATAAYPVEMVVVPRSIRVFTFVDQFTSEACH